MIKKKQTTNIFYFVLYFKNHFCDFLNVKKCKAYKALKIAANLVRLLQRHNKRKCGLWSYVGKIMVDTRLEGIKHIKQSEKHLFQNLFHKEVSKLLYLKKNVYKIKINYRSWWKKIPTWLSPLLKIITLTNSGKL